MDLRNKNVIVELNDGWKVEGLLAEVDKKNMTIHILNPKRFTVDEKGNNSYENSSQKELFIKKEEIKEVKVIQYENPPQINQNEKPLVQSTSSQPQTKEVQIPPNLGEAKAKYVKDNFFDELQTQSSKQSSKETNRDNDKNAETFNLPPDYNEGRGRGNRGRGRGGYNKRGGGGGYKGNNYNNSYYQKPQRSYNNQEQRSYNNSYYNNSNNNDFGNNYGYRGSNRGGYNKRGGRQDYNNQESTGKSIYDS